MDFEVCGRLVGFGEGFGVGDGESQGACEEGGGYGGEWRHGDTVSRKGGGKKNVKLDCACARG
jgi:hypothetical protein